MKRLSPFFLFLVLCALPRTAQGLTISAPGEVSLNSGDFVDVSLGAAGIPSDATGFTFSVSGLPSGVTSAIIDFGYNSGAHTSAAQLTLTAGASVPSGVHTVTVTGTPSGGSGSAASTTIELTIVGSSAADFALSVDPVSVETTPGGAPTTTVTMLPVGGFSATVSYVITSALPTGVGYGFGAPAPSSLGFDSILTLTTTASTPTGSYPLRVAGTGGGLTHETQVTLVVSAVVAPNVTLTVEPTTLQVAQGGKADADLMATWNTGTPAPLSYSVAGLPAGVTVSYTTPEQVGNIYFSEMIVNAAVTAAAGTYPITVSGTASGVTKTVEISLIVTTGTLTLSVSPGTGLVAPGGSASSALQVVLMGGFNSSPELTATPLPAGTTAVFNPGTATGGTLHYEMVLTTTGPGPSKTPAGSYPLTVSVTWSSLTATQPYTLRVVEPDFTIAATPATVNVAPGFPAAVTVTTLDSGSLEAAVALSVTGAPTGVTAVPAPATIPAPGTGSSILAVSADPTAVPGSSPLTVTGTSGSIVHGAPVTVKVYAAFSIVSVTPAAGTYRGGTAVTISGFGFQAGAAVTFNGNAASLVSVADPKTIAAVTPEGPGAGPVDVVVRNPGGATATLAEGYTYTVPLGLGFYVLAPCRVFDTREVTAPIEPGERRNVIVQGICNIPATARSVALNVTVVQPTGGGFLTLFAGDLPEVPGTSTINFLPGQVRANNAIVLLGADGSLGIHSSSTGTTDIVVDVVGYFE